MHPPRRKKWTEAEERTLIDKYGDMICDGSLSKMKTREKKYKPIALHVNSVHHSRDPNVYPWEWSWKDVSNKVQNMRHQYSLVKQKIKRSESNGDVFEWLEGLTHWSNFLRYKEVFGDVMIPFGNGFDEGNQEMEVVEFGNIGSSGGGGEYHNGVMGLEFDYEGGEGDENFNTGNGNGNGNENHVYGEIETLETRKKRKVARNLEKKAWGFVANQLAKLRDMEARFEHHEEERECVRVKNEERREKQWEERKKFLERLKEQRNQEWESIENEREERRRRRDEEIIQEKKWEERINGKRIEWKVRIDEMLSEHRVEMAQIQGRILEEQQNLTSQLLGIVSQWSGQPSGISDNVNGSSHYLSQMMQNLQHVGGMADGDGDTQVEGHNQDDQFIVDG